MEREEKEAFWLLTNMLYENVAPGSLRTFPDQKQVLYFTKLASNYISEGRLIPKQVLDFIKSKVILADLRSYIDSILNYRNDNQSVSREKDKSTLRLLLDEIKTQEQVELPEEENNLLSASQLRYLEKLIYGKAKKKDLLFEGCARCQN